MRGRGAYQVTSAALLIAWCCTAGLLVFLIAVTVISIVQFSPYERSQETQRHGIRVAAVADNRPCLDGCEPGTPIPLALRRPVDGRRTSSLNPVRWDPMTATVAVTVLVDPQAPGYAELPGQPTDRAGSYLVPAIVAWPLLLGLMALLTWLMRWSRGRAGRGIWRDLIG